MRPTDDMKMAYDSHAILRVRNAREAGGERATARGITPEIEDCGDRYVGWDTVSQRDFRPTREEHVIYVAFKEAEQNYATPTMRRSNDRLGGPIWAPSNCPVRLTLRGDNLSEPLSYDFTLRVEGSGGRLYLEPAT